MKKLVLFAVVVAGIALSSCKKEAAPVKEEVDAIEQNVVAAGDTLKAEVIDVVDSLTLKVEEVAK